MLLYAQQVDRKHSTLLDKQTHWSNNHALACLSRCFVMSMKISISVLHVGMHALTSQRCMLQGL